MLTVVCQTPGNLREEERERPLPTADDVLLRVKRVGVCGTDLHIFTGDQPYLDYPRVMGHELSGVVENAPAGSPLAAGDPVFVMPYLSCQRCGACVIGKTNCCVNLEVLGVHRDGAFTEYLSVPQAFVHKADGVTLDQAAMVEFLAIGAHAVRRGNVRAGQRVLVAGVGPIGMAVVIFSRLRGATVTALDTRRDRLDFCLEHLGAAAAEQVGTGEQAAIIRRTNGEMFDVVLDATGNARAMERGFQFVAHGGTYVFVSVVRDNITFSDPDFHKREVSLLGSRNATMEDFESVLTAMRANEIPHEALNTHRLQLRSVKDQFAMLLDPAQHVVKAIVEC